MEFQLQPVKKQYTADQDKAMHPRDTCANTIAALRRAFPEKKLEITETDHGGGYYVFDCSDGELRTHGKGASYDQARASAIMEFAERTAWYAFDYKNAPGYRLISANALASEQPIDKLDSLLSVAYQKNIGADGHSPLLSLIRSIPLHWINAWSLTHSRPALYPINFCNNYQSSNGLAAGNTKEEAILQGLCEVIERHNVSKTIYALRDRPGNLINPGSINNEIVQTIINTHARKNVSLYLFDGSADIGVPTILACGIDRNPNAAVSMPVFGYGTAASPEKAMIRALTEYTQLRARMNTVKRNDRDIWEAVIKLDIEAAIKRAQSVDLGTLTDLSCSDIKDELITIINLLASQGREVIIADKTHPALGIPTYRIIVPGLQPGTAIRETMSENEGVLIAQLYLQAGLRDEASAYYRAHFREIVRDYRVFFQTSIDSILKVLRQAAGGSPLLKLINLDVDSFSAAITPEKLPMTTFCKEDYREIYKSPTKTPGEALDTNQFKFLKNLL